MRIIFLLILTVTTFGQDHIEFERDLDKVRKAMKVGRWKPARDQLDKLLEKHARQTYVLGRRREICELIEEIAFRIRAPEPKPNDLVAGNVRRYSERTGDIDIEWIGSLGEDWVETELKRQRVFVAPMTGPFVFEYEVSSAGSVRLEEVSLIVDADTRYFVRPGFFGSTGLSFGRDGKIRDIERKVSPIQRGKACRLQFDVRRSKVTMKYNGKRIASFKKDADHWGRLTMSGTPLAKLSLKGRVDRAWIQNRRSLWRQAMRESFTKSFSIRQAAPEWLLEEPEDSQKAREEREANPWKLGRRHEGSYRMLIDDLDAGKVDLVAERLASERGKAIPEPARSWIVARLEFATGREAAALETLEALPAEFLGGHVLRARALARLGRDAEAARVTDELLERFPESVEGLEALARDLLEVGRAEHANSVLERVRSLGAQSDEIEGLARLIRYAVDGPSWPRRFDFESPHYHVFSDIDQATCRKAAGILEEGHRAYRKLIGRVDESEKRRFRVYVFSGRAGYAAYMKELGAEAGLSAGVYFFKLKQLLIWNTDAEQMLSTIRHEGFHQYFDRVVHDDAPLWFNEGLAEYFEEAEPGRFARGNVRKEHVARLSKSGVLRDPREFIALKPEAFMQSPLESYAQSWAIVHFLRHSTRENQALFDDLLEKLKTMPALEAQRAAFDGIDWPAFTKALRTHIDSLP